RPHRTRTPGEALMPSWPPLPDDTHFPLENLPYGVFSTGSDERRRIGVAIGDHVLDAGATARALAEPFAGLLDGPTLNPLMAAGPDTWRTVRAAITGWLSDESHRAVVEPLLTLRAEAVMHL